MIYFTEIAIEFLGPIWYIPLPLYIRRRCFFFFFVLDEHQSKPFVLYYRPDPAVEEGKKKHGGKNSEDEKDQNVKDDVQEKQTSKKKGKGKKGKKGKGRGKKSNREVSEKDKTALKEFLDSLRGTRRLMVRTFSIFELSSDIYITNACIGHWTYICPCSAPSRYTPV